MIVAFVDEMRAEGHAVESTCRVLREQGCQVAARTYRLWAQPDRPIAARVRRDAVVEGTVRELAWTVDEHGCRRLTPEGLYGRRKMTALVRRRLPDASAGSVDRAMRSLACTGFVGPRESGPRSRPRTARGPVICSTGTSPRPPRTGPGSWTSRTAGPGPAESTLRSSSTCSPKRSLPGTPRGCAMPIWCWSL